MSRNGKITITWTASRDLHFIFGLMAHRVPVLVAELGGGRRAASAAPLRRAG
jgi:hypothetical protein